MGLFYDLFFIFKLYQSLYESIPYFNYIFIFSTFVGVYYVIYNTNFFKKKSCAICLEDITIEPYNKTNVKLNCGHVFHIECMRLWTISKNPNSLKCPMCRGEIISRISYRF